MHCRCFIFCVYYNILGALISSGKLLKHIRNYLLNIDNSYYLNPINIEVHIMPVSEAQKKAIAKWQKEKMEEIKFRVPKGKKAVIKDYAEKCGESVNAFLLRAVDEAMERGSEKKQGQEWQ